MAEQYPVGYRIKHSFFRFGSILPWLLLVSLIIWGLWFAFNKPSQKITVEEGGKATFINKTSRFFIPFIEAGIEQKSNSELATFIRAGLRVEF